MGKLETGIEVFAVNRNRRQFLGRVAALGASCGAVTTSFAQGNDTIRLGQSVALTGPLAELGLSLHQGAEAAFRAVNAKGGIAGKEIDLIARDDGYDVKRAVSNVKTFLDDPRMFGLFGCMGTPMIEAILPLIRNTDVPCFAPLTGATSARPVERNVINIRAGYTEETERLVEHLATIGLRRIALAYQENSFGAEVRESARAAAAKFGLAIVSMASIKSTGEDATQAAKRIAASQPEAVLIGLAGKPTIDFVRAIKALKIGSPLYALSVMGSAATLSALKDDGVGLAISQVVPLPTHAVIPIVRDFLQAWKASDAKGEPTHLALEGYINARVFIEALRRSAPTFTRSAFVNAVWSMKQLDLGGFQIGFDTPGRNASRFVELTMVSRSGRFVR